MIRFFTLMPIGNMRVAAGRQWLNPVGRRAFAWIVGIIMLAANCGCQCCCCGTNLWSRAVDCGVDHAVPFDCLYCSKLDLTRINRPCGWQCGCCCRPTACCAAGVVYAHRWNSPLPEIATSSGLQSVPTFPATDPGPYMPMPPSNEATPLFDAPVEAAPAPMAEPVPPTDVPPDAGVVPMRYLAPASEPEGRVRLETSPLLVPTEVLFGN